MKLIITPKEQWELVKPIWRILIIAFVIQTIGGVIGVIMSRYGQPFVDFWFGAAIATFPGFIAGSIIHELKSESKIKDNMPTFAFIGMICFGLTIMAFIMPLEKMALQIQQSGGF